MSSSRNIDPEEARPEDLAAEKQVLGDRHRGRDGKILVDRLDALPPGVAGAVELHHAAVQPYLACVGSDRAGQRLDERRLAGAVVADDGQNLAGQQIEVGAIQGRDLPVPLHQAARLQDGCEPSSP